MSVRAVTAAEFEELRASGAPLLVDCYAEWCGPCKTIAPAIEAMAKANPTVQFVKVDVDAEETLAATLEVNCMPTFIGFKGGREVKRFGGAMESMVRLVVDAVAKA